MSLYIYLINYNFVRWPFSFSVLTVLNYCKSFTYLMFFYALLGPVFGGVFLLFISQGADLFIRPDIGFPKLIKAIPRTIGLSYIGGIIPAILAGIMNWLILACLFHIKKNSYWLQAILTSIFYVAISAIGVKFLPSLFIPFGLFSIFICAFITNGKAVRFISNT